MRSEFDELLLRHAAECGATVLEEHKVTEVHFEGSEGDAPASRRPYAVTYTRPSGETGLIEFDYLVDASGRNGIMSTKVGAHKLSLISLRSSSDRMTVSQE